MANQLVNESSPYLLQHANNPVNWHPWGEEALTKARTENKPIFLSIGYSACHWCHRMREESFEDEETAAFMNEHFINIKVDREERPDIDAIYMQATVAMTGSGGWPMSVFLTPDLRPFYAGTYFPPVPRYNMPSFKDLLAGIARAWKEEPGEITRVSDQVSGHLQAAISSNQAGDTTFTQEDLDTTVKSLNDSYDWGYGGWGAALGPILAGFMARYNYFLLFIGDALTTLVYGLIILWRVPETQPAAAVHTARVPIQTRAKQLSQEPVLLFFTGFSPVFGTIYMQGNVTLPLDMQSHGLGPSDYGLAIALNGMLVVLLTLPLSQIVAHWPRFGAMALAGFLLSIGFGITELTRDLPVYALSVAIWALGEIIGATVAPVIIADLSPVELRGLYQGLFGSA